MAAEVPSSSGSSSGSDVVEIRVPLRPEYATTVRTVAASLGADAGFSVDELDDLRLALSEVFSVMAELGTKDSRATLSFAVSDDTMSIDVSADGLDGAVEFDELATTILQSVVDDHRIDQAVVTLTKRAGEASGGVVAGASTS
jgi:serine/threonine-protein kinase RsbW